MKVQQLHQLTKVQTETPATIAMNLQLQRKYVLLLKSLTLTRMSARLHNHLQLMKVQQLHQLTKVQTETPATIPNWPLKQAYLLVFQVKCSIRSPEHAKLPRQAVENLMTAKISKINGDHFTKTA
jgi:hypothetical protein